MQGFAQYRSWMGVSRQIFEVYPLTKRFGCYVDVLVTVVNREASANSDADSQALSSDENTKRRAEVKRLCTLLRSLGAFRKAQFNY